MASSKIKLYDLSAKTREVLEWRNAKRKTLREQYLRQILHPTKQQLVVRTNGHLTLFTSGPDSRHRLRKRRNTSHKGHPFTQKPQPTSIVTVLGSEYNH
ncbi:NADH dehydrogenase (ubiquinone) B15 subunit isoform X2 [Colletes latitarsis]|uniref:NADH dehydrogenase (ubiquinone) B15 subunit isoform X2 n=1 Tax=Colletes latitarsis TaxID=2605962 RepID=UPI004036E9C9